GDLRLHRRERGPDRRAVRPSDRARGARRLSLRRLLGSARHAQGQAQPRGADRERTAAVGGLARRAARRARPGFVMLGLRPPGPGGTVTVLALGAHADDVEIGCAGTLLRLAELYPGLSVHWVVMGCEDEERARGA